MTMMGLRRNLIFSAVLHIIIIIAVIVTLHRGTADRAPANYMIVSLFKEIADITSKTSPAPLIVPQGKREKINNDEIATPPKSDGDDISIKQSTITAYNVNIKGDSTVEVIQLEGIAEETNKLLAKLIDEKNNVTSPSFDKVGIVGFLEQNIHVQNTDSLYAIIRNAIEKAKTYPLLARKRKIEGTVITSFTVNNKGYPQDIKVRKSSGSEILDSAAIKIVKNAAPLPYVKGEITVPISFKLTDYQTYTYR